MRYSIFLTAAIAGPLLAASWYGQSELQARNKAEQIAQQQCQMPGVDCSSPRPRKKKQSCFVASKSHVRVMVTVNTR